MRQTVGSYRPIRGCDVEHPGCRALVALVAISACGSESRPVSRVPTRARLVTIAREARRATNAPGAIVGVQVGTRPAIVVADGTRRRAASEPIRADDPFLSASVSKAFTAATVLSLVRDGEKSVKGSG